jgi:hypothetical protein
MTRAITIHRLAYNRRSPPMAWGDKKTTRDDTDHMKPRQLPSAGYANPEVRAVESVHEALRSNGHASEPPTIDDLVEKRRMEELEREMSKPKIEQIKDLVGALTYGQMIELRDQVATFMPNIGNKEVVDLIIDKLPQTLHAWATA